MTLPNEFEIKQNDTLPKLVLQVFQSNGLPVDFTGITDITIWVRRAGVISDVIIDGGHVAVVDNTKGIISYSWQSEDTSTAGNFEAEIRVVTPGHERFTVPSDGTIPITIIDDIEYNADDPGFTS